MDKARKLTDAHITLTTIGPINENFAAPPNTRKELLNDEIRKLATETHCQLADVSRILTMAIAAEKATDHLLDNFMNAVYFDNKQCTTNALCDELSKQRNLQLTIDGVHFNSSGARIFKDVVLKALQG